MSFEQEVEEMISPMFKIKPYSDAKDFPKAVMESISLFLKPRKGKASKSKLYYLLRTSDGEFRVSPTGSLTHFSTTNRELDEELTTCMQLNDTIQGYITYHATDCIEELNRIFIALIRENCKEYTFLKDFLVFYSKMGIPAKAVFEIACAVGILFYIKLSLKVIRKMIM